MVKFYTEIINLIKGVRENLGLVRVSVPLEGLEKVFDVLNKDINRLEELIKKTF